MEKLISVVVCTYNQADTISRTLDSILAQECSWPLEIIIGEDHSADDTLTVCRHYADKFPDIIRIIAREQNVGLVDNYFGCLLEARGEYIADLAGGDEWCDNRKLEKELAIMEEHADVVLVHTDYQLRIEQTGEIKPAMPYWSKKGISSGNELTTAIFLQYQRPLAHLCTSLYRNTTFRECYNEYPEFFHGRKYPCEDLQLTVFLSTKGKFAYIDEITLNYSISNTSISNIASYEKQWHFVKGAAQLRYDLAKELALTENADIKANMTFQVYVLMMHAFRVHSKELRAKTIKLTSLWEVQPNVITKLVRIITSTNLTWCLYLAIRRVVLSLKKKVQ